MNSFFIVGCQRSGTTMIQQALNRHSRMLIPPETGFFTHFLGHARKGQACHIRQINRDLDIALLEPQRRIRRTRDVQWYFEEMMRQYVESSGKNQVELLGEKTPHHLLQIKRIATHFPGAKVIIVYRDGRDVALSLTKVPWFSNDLLVCFGYWLRCCRAQARAVRAAHLAVHCVQYESFTADPETELRRICTFLDIAYEEAMVQSRGDVRGVAHAESPWMKLAGQPITRARTGAWRSELSAAQARTLSRWGWRTLTSLGYEVDSDSLGKSAMGTRIHALASTVRWRSGNALRVLRKNLFGMDEFA